MRTVFLLCCLLPTAGMAEETKGTSQPVAQESLQPLTVEEEELLLLLEAIENDPAILAQAKAESEIPLEAFGGE